MNGMTIIGCGALKISKSWASFVSDSAAKPRHAINLCNVSKFRLLAYSFAFRRLGLSFSSREVPRIQLKIMGLGSAPSNT